MPCLPHADPAPPVSERSLRGALEGNRSIGPASTQLWVQISKRPCLEPWVLGASRANQALSNPAEHINRIIKSHLRPSRSRNSTSSKPASYSSRRPAALNSAGITASSTLALGVPEQAFSQCDCDCDPGQAKRRDTGYSLVLGSLPLPRLLSGQQGSITSAGH